MTCRANSRNRIVPNGEGSQSLQSELSAQLPYFVHPVSASDTIFDGPQSGNRLEVVGDLSRLRWVMSCSAVVGFVVQHPVGSGHRVGRRDRRGAAAVLRRPQTCGVPPARPASPPPILPQSPPEQPALVLAATRFIPGGMEKVSGTETDIRFLTPLFHPSDTGCRTAFSTAAANPSRP